MASSKEFRNSGNEHRWLLPLLSKRIEFHENPSSMLTLNTVGDLHILWSTRRGFSNAAQHARSAGGFLDRNH